MSISCFSKFRMGLSVVTVEFHEWMITFVAFTCISLIFMPRTWVYLEKLLSVFRSHSVLLKFSQTWEIDVFVDNKCIVCLCWQQMHCMSLLTTNALYVCCLWKRRVNVDSFRTELTITGLTFFALMFMIEFVLVQQCTVNFLVGSVNCNWMTQLFPQDLRKAFSVRLNLS